MLLQSGKGRGKLAQGYLPAAAFRSCGLHAMRSRCLAGRCRSGKPDRHLPARLDTAPNRGDENAGLFRLADLVLVPVRPSPSDLWAISATVALLKREGTPFLFVVNQATLNANITAQAIASLSHHGPVAETIIGARVHYAAALTDGHSAPELASRGPAAQEIAALWTNIKACLHASMPTAKVTAHA